jgi:hypothetical protein
LFVQVFACIWRDCTFGLRPAPAEARLARRLIQLLFPESPMIQCGIRKLQTFFAVAAEAGGRRWKPCWTAYFLNSASAGDVEFPLNVIKSRHFSSCFPQTSRFSLIGGLAWQWLGPVAPSLECFPARFFCRMMI